MSNTIKTAEEIWKEDYHSYAYDRPANQQGYSKLDEAICDSMRKYHAQFSSPAVSDEEENYNYPNGKLMQGMAGN